jgi:hypothetical protein
MQDTNPWYNLKGSNTGDNLYHAQESASSSSAPAPASIRDPHTLPGVYSFTPPTPTPHGEYPGPDSSQLFNICFLVSRQSHLSMDAHYVQPHYYTTNGYHYPSPNPPPYTEYAADSNRLQSFSHSESRSSYWTSTTSDSSRYVDGQSSRHVLPLPS